MRSSSLFLAAPQIVAKRSDGCAEMLNDSSGCDALRVHEEHIVNTTEFGGRVPPGQSSRLATMDGRFVGRGLVPERFLSWRRDSHIRASRGNWATAAPARQANKRLSTDLGALKSTMRSAIGSS